MYNIYKFIRDYFCFLENFLFFVICGELCCVRNALFDDLSW